MLGQPQFASRKITTSKVPRLTKGYFESKAAIYKSQGKLDENKPNANSHNIKISEAYITPPRTKQLPSPKNYNKFTIRSASVSTKTTHRTTTTVVSTENTPKKRFVSREVLKTSSTPKRQRDNSSILKEQLNSVEKVYNPSRNSSRSKIAPPDYKASFETFADKQAKYNHLGSDSVFQSSLRTDNWQEMVQDMKHSKKHLEYSYDFDSQRCPTMTPKEFIDTINQESRLLKPQKKFEMYAPRNPKSYLLSQASPSPSQKSNKKTSEILNNKSRTPVKPPSIHSSKLLDDSKSNNSLRASTVSNRPDSVRDSVKIEVPKRPKSRPSSVRPAASRRQSHREEMMTEPAKMLESPKSERSLYVLTRSRIRTPDKMEMKHQYSDSKHFEKAKAYSKESENMKQSLHTEIDEMTEKIKAQLTKPSYLVPRET